MRLDIFLSQKGLAKSRTRAAELISSGFVTVNGVTVKKSSYDVDDAAEVAVVGEEHSFVGRGGMKLEGALDSFGIDPAGLTAADIGASTGGFTDCLLKRGAARVYAVDSGHDQLDPTLRNDPRVVNIEGCNARFLDSSVIPEKCDMAVCDLSFISQTLVLPAISGILSDGAYLISLIKPQFECGREGIGKGGIVKDKKQHMTAIERVLACAAECTLAPIAIMRSPIKGGDGNTEFLFLAQKGGAAHVTKNDISEALNE